MVGDSLVSTLKVEKADSPKTLIIMFLGFCRDVDEVSTLLGYYAASSGNPLPTFRDQYVALKHQ
jgi:hypothetical protein